MTLSQFISVCKKDTIRDIALICTVDDSGSVLRFYQSYGGPLVIQFDTTSFVISQAERQEDITFEETSLADWIANAEKVWDQYKYAIMSVYELFAFRLGEYEPRPTVDRVTKYVKHNPLRIPGLTLTLSTGGLIGIDATSDGGLKYFLDGQERIFFSDCATRMGLSAELAWERFADDSDVIPKL